MSVQTSSCGSSGWASSACSSDRIGTDNPARLPEDPTCSSDDGSITRWLPATWRIAPAPGGVPALAARYARRAGAAVQADHSSGDAIMISEGPPEVKTGYRRATKPMGLLAQGHATLMTIRSGDLAPDPRPVHVTPLGRRCVCRGGYLGARFAASRASSAASRALRSAMSRSWAAIVCDCDSIVRCCFCSSLSSKVGSR